MTPDTPTTPDASPASPNSTPAPDPATIAAELAAIRAGWGRRERLRALAGDRDGPALSRPNPMDVMLPRRAFRWNGRAYSPGWGRM